MAQIVGFFKDFTNETERKRAYSEGPFVVGGLTGGYRVECEFKNHQCPVLPDLSINELRSRLGHVVCISMLSKPIEEDVDELNALVEKGEIICNDKGAWVAKCLTCGDTKWMPGSVPCPKCNKEN